MIAAKKIETFLRSLFTGASSDTGSYKIIFEDTLSLVLQEVRFPSLLKRVPIIGGVGSNLDYYVCPDDLYAPMSIINNQNQVVANYVTPDIFDKYKSIKNNDGFGYQGDIDFTLSSSGYDNKYDSTNSESFYTIIEINDVRYIRISKDFYPTNKIYPINTMDTLVGINKTPNTDLSLNNYNYITNNSSINFNVSDQEGQELSALTNSDLTNVKFGFILLPIYITNVENLKSLSFSLYNNQIETNYTIPLTTLVEGINYIKIPTETFSTPDLLTSQVGFRIKARSNPNLKTILTINSITAQQNEFNNLEYYSWNLFVDGITGQDKNTINVDVDYLKLNTITENIFKYRAAMRLYDALYTEQDVTRNSYRLLLKDEYEKAKQKFFEQYPMPQQYPQGNYKPNVRIKKGLFFNGYGYGNY